MINLFHQLHRVITKYKNMENVEIEVRFGFKKKEIGANYFDANIQKTFYDMIKKRLESSLLERINEKTQVYVMNRKRVITQNTEIKEVHKKRKIESIDFSLLNTPYDIRISVSQEQPCTLTPCERDEFMNELYHIRSRDRITYKYKYWNFDLSKIYRRNYHDTFYKDYPLETYEFEIELNLNDILDVNDVYLAHSFYMKIIDFVMMNDNEKINLKQMVLNSIKQ